MRRVLPRDFCIRSPSFQKKKRAKKEREFSRKQAPRHAHASPSKLSLEKGVHRDLSYYFIFSPLTFQPTSRAWARPRPSRWVSSVFKIGASPPSPPLRFRTTFANVRGEQFLFFFRNVFSIGGVLRFESENTTMTMHAESRWPAALYENTKKKERKRNGEWWTISSINNARERGWKFWPTNNRFYG